MPRCRWKKWCTTQEPGGFCEICVASFNVLIVALEPGDMFSLVCPSTTLAARQTRTSISRCHEAPGGYHQEGPPNHVCSGGHAQSYLFVQRPVPAQVVFRKTSILLDIHHPCVERRSDFFPRPNRGQPKVQIQTAQGAVNAELFHVKIADRLGLTDAHFLGHRAARATGCWMVSFS